MTQNKACPRKFFIKENGKDQSRQHLQLEELMLISVKRGMDYKEEKQREEINCHPNLHNIIEEYTDIFQPLSGILLENKIQHETNLMKGAHLIMKRPYRLSDMQAKEVERQIKKALGKGWIQSSFSPWGIVIFVVGKKNGE